MASEAPGEKLSDLLGEERIKDTLDLKGWQGQISLDREKIFVRISFILIFIF
jgi:hypothetical protein